jgi:uncharacterized protein (PEP-CTERM system associated)
MVRGMSVRHSRAKLCVRRFPKGGSARHAFAGRRPNAWILRSGAGFLVAGGAAFWTVAAQARDWIVTPRVSLYESYTSNASLAPDGHDSSDFFTTLVPSIGIRGDTARLKLSLDYSLEAIAYAENSDLDQLRNNLNFVSTLTLVPEQLFVDGAASVQQVPSSGQAPVSASPLAASTNLETVSVYDISPYIKHHFGTFADTELRYTFNQVHSSGVSEGFSSAAALGSNQLSSSTTNGLTLTAASGSQFRRLLWLVVADGANSSFGGTSPDTSSRLVQASGEYRVNRQIGLLGSVGFERISDPTFFPDPEPDGPIGSVGVKYTPSARSSLILNVNHRYDSNFATGSANYLIGPQTQIRAGYTEQVFTSSQLQFSNNLSFLTTDEFGNFIDSRTEQLFSLSSTTFGVENNAFRQRSFDIGFHAVRGRNTFDAGAFWQDRRVFQTGELDTAFGGALSWSRALTRVANLNLTIRYANEQFNGPQFEDNQQLFGLGGSLVYQLNDTLDGIFAVNFTRQLADIPTDQFTETVLSIGLQKRF